MFCDTALLSASGSDSPTREQTIMRIDWSLDRLDTLGTFFQSGRSVGGDGLFGAFRRP